MHSVTRINETLARITSERERIKDDEQTMLRALSRKMEISKQSMEATVSAAGRKEHGANMLRLDREKFALAKGINELESSAHGLEGQLARLKEELEQVDGEDPMQSALVEAEDGTLLKLKVYRSLGIDLQEDGAAGYSKAVIRGFTFSSLPALVGRSLIAFCRKLFKGRYACRQYREKVLTFLLCELLLERYVIFL